MESFNSRTNDLLTVGKVLYVLIRGVNIDEERFNLVKEIELLEIEFGIFGKLY
jgi:hypothetical protein